VETVPLRAARGRVLAQDMAARRTQPPFAASSMDGYAVRRGEVGQGARFTVIGESAAGRGYRQPVLAGQAVRIFTGAPVPDGADTVVIQEDTDRDGDRVLVREGGEEGRNIRLRGFDFREGDQLLPAGRRMGPREISLAAAMGHRAVAVHRRPRIAILSTGDELVPPGGRPGPGQIIASNHLGIGALCEAAGAKVQQLGIARDTREDLLAHASRASGADVLVTSGGASVGDHDLVAPVLESKGMAIAFWKIALRPGKPLMFGRLGASRVLGLPGKRLIFKNGTFFALLITCLLNIYYLKTNTNLFLISTQLTAYYHYHKK
jgi:molybdopterin molybdotransferase